MESLLLFVIAAICGAVIGWSLLYLSSAKQAILLRKASSGKKIYILIDFLFRLFVPIIFAILGLLLPHRIIMHLLQIGILDIQPGKAMSIYLYTFVIVFFSVAVYLYKTGKIKTTKKLI